ncbi:MAG: DNA replication/repair protein RecF [Woeseia sp.]
MPLKDFKASNFRCLRRVSLEADPQFNLIHGPNASGKTSMLEAIAYLGRGKSFRGARPQDLVRYGTAGFQLHGRADTGTRLAAVGVRNSGAGLEVRIDGDRETSAAALVEILPLQVVDPDIHNLVAGGPERRRRYLDWIAFHVKQGYSEWWRRLNRALRQRNAGLRHGMSRVSIAVWDQEFLEAAAQVDEMRRSVLEHSRKTLEETGSALLDCTVGFEYRQGWAVEQGLEDSLAASWHRDLATGVTQVGPHRADLGLIYEERQARRFVSRGQQKLLASAMVLAATEAVQAVLERPLLLLLDDPAAELDQASLDRLMRGVFSLGCQVVATALVPEAVEFPGPPALFHVEHGKLRQGQ